MNECSGQCIGTQCNNVDLSCHKLLFILNFFIFIVEYHEILSVQTIGKQCENKKMKTTDSVTLTVHNNS